jgi:GR25 family glycosyltransferase involved in LPS biosynthesis
MNELKKDDNSKGFPPTWQAILHAPAFILNCEEEKTRWKTTVERVQGVGFTNIQQFTGINAHKEDAKERLKTEWQKHGSPYIWGGHATQYACYLGHVGIWKKMIDEKISYATIFEDDIVFHSKFSELAPLYYEKTPKAFDVCFYGSEHEKTNFQDLILKKESLCCHAYGLTLAGARKLYTLLLGSKYSAAPYVVDQQLRYFQKQSLFEWYNWNGVVYPCAMYDQPGRWSHRNTGLVFQDNRIDSTIYW